MPFNSWDSFSQFRWEITHTSRFFYSEATKAFLEAIKESASDMVSEFPKDVPLWRAQVGCVYIDEELPSPNCYLYQELLLIVQAVYQALLRLHR
jgi:hypothetical protein